MDRLHARGSVPQARDSIAGGDIIGVLVDADSLRLK